MNRVLIVTPYFKESRETLERCIASVSAQTVAADHLLVADGHSAGWIDALSVRHLKLDRAHANFGNTPRAVGMLLGLAEGYEMIGLLDADNWFDPRHIETCLTAASSAPSCDYVIARRRFRRPDGSVMPLPDEPPGSHVDTSCFFFLEGSFGALPLWGTMPNAVSPVCDRIFYAACIERGLRAAATDQATVNFEVTVRGFFELIGETPPPQAKEPPDFAAMAEWLDALDERGLEIARRRAGVRLRQSASRDS